MEEINVKIVKGLDGKDCDVDVPMDATVGDVIVGLIDNGFLDPDNPPAAINVLYNKDGKQGTVAGTKYDDRSKTVKEYGWETGQTLCALADVTAG